MYLELNIALKNAIFPEMSVNFVKAYWLREAYSESNQTSKMELLVKLLAVSSS